MKLTELINALSESKEAYGDINVEIIISAEDGTLSAIEPDSPIYFSYGQYADGEDVLGIQNFPY